MPTSEIVLTLIHGRSELRLPKLADNSIDLLTTDPPYGISFLGRDWDTFNEVVSPRGAYEHKKGFKKLPRQSTKSMAEFFVPIWRECMRVMKPGAFAFVMCAPRQDVLAKQICCLQEAGFETGFSSLYWSFASGFPKAMNVSKGIDKKMGLKREVVGTKLGRAGYSLASEKAPGGYSGMRYDSEAECAITAPACPQSQALEGSYAGFQPKPAVEVILVAMKPLTEETYMAQALANRKGVTWLDDGRIPFASKSDAKTARENALGPVERYKTVHPVYEGGKKSAGFADTHDPKGRFPANLLVSDDALNDGITRKSGYMREGIVRKTRTGYSGMMPKSTIGTCYGDSGSFSRHFSLDAWWDKRIGALRENVRNTIPFLVTRKPSTAEKDEGCENLYWKVVGGEAIGVEEWNTLGAEEDRLEKETGQRPSLRDRGNIHPTVKPASLFSYLITIGSRRGDLVLDPFVGSGTTMLASVLMSRSCIGVEDDPRYIRVAKARLNWGQGLGVKYEYLEDEQ